MAISYEELTDKHPCYARGKKGSTGRIHLPISPTCNIECRFCDRRINDYEKRPGVASTVIKPNEAIDVIRKSLELCPAIKVAGIAMSAIHLRRHLTERSLYRCFCQLLCVQKSLSG